MILGDNIFHGHGLTKRLRDAANKKTGATVFGYYVDDPERFGVVEFDKDGKAISIEEKPEHPNQIMQLQGYTSMMKRLLSMQRVFNLVLEVNWKSLI